MRDVHHSGVAAGNVVMARRCHSLVASSFTRETAYACEEVDDALYLDLELTQYCFGCSPIDQFAYGSPCASANDLRCCLEFDGDLYRGQCGQRKRYQLQG
ncbi:hypothetical protein GCM10007901_03240 [Dyella acidisoli]|uniref:Uncharacterized protein n=1 Tax=Dyella acidisoli TaxID=1867834 RepID=A0ABQ5XJL1_9GAMM|nr:hypothetical protein GCM10007901_03240 [Dyella acidisoli]